MARTRSFDEQINVANAQAEKYYLKAKQCEQRAKDAAKKKAAEDRKKRNHRLIELGGIIEMILGRDTDDSDKDKLIAFLNQQEINGNYFTKEMNKKPVTSEENGTIKGA